MLTYILKSFLLQILFSVGAVALVAAAIGGANKLISRLMSRRAYKLYVVTGIIGTPIHELGHAIFCPLFGHKITGISLYNPDPSNGYLGYVRHTYNSKNVYQRIGCFFISIGPLVSGTLAIVGLMYLLAPDVANSLAGIKDIALMSLNFADDSVLSEIWYLFSDSFRALFSADAVTSVGWWFFMLLSMTVSMHMTLSKADVKSSISGALCVIVLLFVVCFAVGMISTDALETYNGYFVTISVYVLNLMTLSLILCGVMIIIAAIISLAATVFGRK